MALRIKRYALAWCVVTYMAGIVLLRAAGLFPRAGIYDISRLIGGTHVTLEGRVLDSPVIRWNQTRFVMEARAVPLGAFEGKTLVTLAFPHWGLAPGSRVRLRGWLSATRPPSASRPFDEQGYWGTKKVFSMLKVWSAGGFTLLQEPPAWSLQRRAWEFHRRYREFWEDVLPPDEAALLLGITMGARGVLSKPIKDACIRAGVYHIVVVSGQNMSLIVALVVGLLYVLRVPRRRAFWICIVPVLFYTAAVGGDPPVMRAAVMSLAGLLILALGRDVPRFYPLLIAAGWILWNEPEALLGASFQLSFGATLSILAILPLWNEESPVTGRWWRWLVEAGLIGLIVHLGIWPLLVHYFQRLSLAGFLANWTIFPLSGILMVVGLVIGTWWLVLPGTVPEFLVQMIHAMVRFTLQVIQRMAAWDWAIVPVTPPPWWACGLYYGFLFGILFVIHRRKIHAETYPQRSSSRPRL